MIAIGEVIIVPLGLLLSTMSRLAPARLAELAAAAERAGFSDVLLSEGNADAIALCHPLAAATSAARIGTGIAGIGNRHPMLAARAAATVHDASGGRFVLGVGTGVAPGAPPVTAIEEYVAAVRAVLAGRAYDGTVYTAPALPLDRPPEYRMPVHIAAMGPRMLETAGRIADGVLLNLMSPRQAGDAARQVRAAAQAAGRDPNAVSVGCVVHCCLSDDPASARAAALAVVPRYVLHPSGARLFAEYDDGALREVQALMLAGDRRRAALRVPESVADSFVVSGDAAVCRAGIDEYRRAGVDLPVIYAMPVAGEWHPEAMIDAFAEPDFRGWLTPAH